MNRNASTCRSALLLCSTLLLLGGCASRWQDMFVSYSDQMVPLRNQLLLGHAAEALPEVRDSTLGDDTFVLDRLEEGASPGSPVRMRTASRRSPPPTAAFSGKTIRPNTG